MPSTIHQPVRLPKPISTLNCVMIRWATITVVSPARAGVCTLDQTRCTSSCMPLVRYVYIHTLYEHLTSVISARLSILQSLLMVCCLACCNKPQDHSTTCGTSLLHCAHPTAACLQPWLYSTGYVGPTCSNGIAKTSVSCTSLDHWSGRQDNINPLLLQEIGRAHV